MKFSCLQNNLQYALTCTTHLANKNLNLPILNNILLQAEETSIRLTTTNLEMAIGCTFRGKIEEKGETTLPSKLFLDYIHLLPKDRIDIVSNQDICSISCGKDQTKIKGTAASEFPLIPSVTIEKTLRLPAELFKNAIARVIFATASQESRPVLAGVFMKISPESKTSQVQLTLAATDSYRLAEVKFLFSPPDSFDDQNESTVIVPVKTMMEIYRILSLDYEDIDTDNLLTIHFSQNQIVFLYGSVELISRTIEGAYPDYQQIIPHQFQTQIVLDREDFQKAIKTASLFSKNNLYDVSISVEPEQNLLSMKAMDANKGENITYCSAQIQGSSNTTITLNFRYLLDGLNAFSKEQVVLQMIDANNPCLLTEKENQLYQYLIMPIRQ